MNSELRHVDHLLAEARSFMADVSPYMMEAIEIHEQDPEARRYEAGDAVGTLVLDPVGEASRQIWIAANNIAIDLMDRRWEILRASDES